jgi:hypothetical protein
MKTKMTSSMNSKLSESDKQDIRNALFGLKGAQRKAEAQIFADFHKVHISTIYTAAKSSSNRKQRSDAGKVKQDILEIDGLRFASELVANLKVSPELALETMKANEDRFGKVNINLGTFRRYLRKKGISRTQSKNNLMTYRPFQAEFPGQIIQFDISGVKERWVDIRTRAIHKVSVLEVSKNHANRRLDRVPLWKFTAKDDNSRFKFVRFVAVNKPNTIHVVEFLKETFQRMGVPFYLYTDNDAIIVNKRMRRGASFINETFKDCGGFEMIQHLPGNPQATGKVERAHQVVEEYEKLIGVSAEYGNQPSLDSLNRFAEWICDRYNNKVNRATGIAPAVAFRATTNPKRVVDPAQFDAAFKARDLSLKITADVCIVVDNVKYQLPRKDSDPFQLLAETGQRIEVYWLDEEAYFACVTPSGDEYIIDKVEAQSDSAFEHKALPETTAQKTKKALKESQKNRIKSVKEERKEQIVDEPIIVVPGIDTPIIEQPKVEGILQFPQRIETGNVEILHELTHHVANSEEVYQVDLFEALDFMQEKNLAPDTPGQELDNAKAWLKTLFNGRETIGENELREALDYRHPENVRKLRLA